MLLSRTLSRNTLDGGNGCVLLLVGPDVIQEQHESNQGPSRLGSQNRDLSRDIVWCVLGLESLRADDVANAEATGDESYGDDSLSLTCHIRGGPLIYDDEGGSDGIDKVDPGQFGAFTFGRKGHQTAAEDTGNTACYDPGPSVGGVADTPAYGQCADD